LISGLLKTSPFIKDGRDICLAASSPPWSPRLSGITKRLKHFDYLLSPNTIAEPDKILRVDAQMLSGLLIRARLRHR